MHKPEKITIAVIVALIVGLTIYGYFDEYPLEAMRFPVLISVCVLAFAAMRFWELRRHEVAAAGRPASAEDDSEDPVDLDIAGVTGPFLWVFGVVLSVWLLGYLVGLPIYIMVYLFAHRVPARITLPITVGMALFIHLIFERVLQVLLPTGVLGRLLF